MNLEQFLAGAVACIALGVLAGVITAKWATKAARQDIGRREDELVVMENQQAEWLAEQQAQMADQIAVERHQADRVLAKAKWINSETRQTLKAATAPFEADEMADTVLVDPVNVQTIVNAARKYL